jgi:hypothetical protein
MRKRSFLVFPKLSTFFFGSFLVNGWFRKTREHVPSPTHMMAGSLQSMLAACLLLALFAGADAGTRRTPGTLYGCRPQPHCVRGFLCNSELRPLASWRCSSPAASSYGAERGLGAARGRGGRESSYTSNNAVLFHPP